VSQGRVKATLCTEKLFLRTKYIYIGFSSHIRQEKMWEGKDTDGQHNTFSGPSWVSHLSAGLSCKI
jgi:hypothetical protein